jgi:hypothetical protein
LPDGGAGIARDLVYGAADAHGCGCREIGRRSRGRLC